MCARHSVVLLSTNEVFLINEFNILGIVRQDLKAHVLFSGQIASVSVTSDNIIALF